MRTADDASAFGHRRRRIAVPVAFDH